MSDSINLTDAKGRDANVALGGLKHIPSAVIGLPNEKLTFKRFVSSTRESSHEALKQRLGENYGQLLVDGDPEIDMEQTGLFIDQTQTIYLDGDGEALFVEPEVVEILFDQQGDEKERRDPIDTLSNVDTAAPVRWTGKNVPITEAVRRFAFQRRLQLFHVNGITFDFLFEIARTLHMSQSLMLVGAGDKGSDPLIFRANGKPYRGFLHGRVDDTRFQLFLLLSAMELKNPSLESSS
jgi:hypothetical protein